MVESKKVSVITPVYNGGKYIQNFLEKIVQQDYVNFEWIIVDDGSTDNTVDIIKNFIRKHQFDSVKLLKKENGGVSSARNLGLNFATGDFIMFADADDTPHVDFVSKYVKKIINNRTDITFFSVGLTDDSGKCVGSQGYDSECVSNIEAIERLLGQLSYGYLFSTISKAELWITNRLDEKIYFLEDEEILVRVLLKANNVAYSSETHYDYVQRIDSVVHNLSINDYENAYQSALAMKKSLLKSRIFSSEQVGNVRVLGTLIPLIVMNWQQGNDDIADEKISEYLFLYANSRIPFRKKARRMVQNILFRLHCKNIVLFLYRNVEF